MDWNNLLSLAAIAALAVPVLVVIIVGSRLIWREWTGQTQRGRIRSFRRRVLAIWKLPEDRAAGHVEQLIADGGLLVQSVDPVASRPDELQSLAPALRALLTTYRSVQVGNSAVTIGHEHLTPFEPEAVAREHGLTKAIDIPDPGDRFLCIGHDGSKTAFFVRADGADETVYRADATRGIEGESPTIHHWLLVRHLAVSSPTTTAEEERA